MSEQDAAGKSYNEHEAKQAERERLKRTDGNAEQMFHDYMRASGSVVDPVEKVCRKVYDFAYMLEAERQKRIDDAAANS